MAVPEREDVLRRVFDVLDVHVAHAQRGVQRPDEQRGDEGNELHFAARSVSDYRPGTFQRTLSRSPLFSTQLSTNPHDVQMNHDVYTAPNTVRFNGIIVAHVRRRETRISFEAHLGHRPVFFTETSWQKTNVATG